MVVVVLNPAPSKNKVEFLPPRHLLSAMPKIGMVDNHCQWKLQCQFYVMKGMRPGVFWECVLLPMCTLRPPPRFQRTPPHSYTQNLHKRLIASAFLFRIWAKYLMSNCCTHVCILCPSTYITRSNQTHSGKDPRDCETVRSGRSLRTSEEIEN